MKRIKLFLKTFAPVIVFLLAYQTAAAQPYTLTVNPPGRFRELVSLATALAGYVRLVAIPIMVIIVAYAGVKFLLARGNTTETGEAKKILWWAVVGIAIIVIGSGFITLIKDILGI